MGKRGPPPDPNSGRTKRGLNSLNPNNIVKLVQPPASVGRAIMPRWLDGYARELWKREAPALRRMGTLDALTRTYFAMCCVQYGHMRQAGDIIAVEGTVVTRPNGSQVRRARDAVLAPVSRQPTLAREPRANV